MGSISYFLRKWRVGLAARGVVSSTATKGVSTNHDYTLTKDAYINKIQLILENHVFGDSVDLQVVMPDGTIINQWGFNWYVEPEVASNRPVETLSRPKKIPAGFKLRLIYHSTGPADVNIRMNAWLYEK